MPSDDNGSMSVNAEQDRRIGAYRTENSVHETLTEMNRVLAPIERYEPSGVARPNLFIFGLPRSGTTLLYQLISACLDVGYINNLAARFWLAPMAGVTLARAVLGDRRDTTYSSEYARSPDPAGPHEFSYFWQRVLGVDSEEVTARYDNLAGTGIDWKRVAQILGSLQDFYQSGLVHKTNFVGNFIGGFARHTPMPVFIYIDRDPGSVALSILKGRLKYYGDVNTWFSALPPNYADLKRLPFDQQIANQVVGLRDAYEQSAASIDQRLVVRVTYAELCQNPAALLTRVCDTVTANHGVTIARIASPPETFPESRSPKGRGSEEAAVLAALDTLMERR